jgi:hypothetical protein
MTIFVVVCTTQSVTVGMPNGLFSLLPDFGIARPPFVASKSEEGPRHFPAP